METESSGNAPAAATSNMRRVIDKDGRIKMVPSSEVPAGKERGFRKGMLPLRDMKMQWTLNDFMALDSQFEFKIQRQELAICKQASLDMPSLADFQGYLQTFQFKRKRMGFLYGTFLSDDAESPTPNKIRVEAIYEPPQEFDATTVEGAIPLDDPKEETVEQIATLLGWTRVGWIFGQHEAREEGHTLSAAEVIMAAEYQLEAAGGVNETPFVTIKVAKGEDGNVAVEAFQVSQQCMAMVAEEALQVGADPKCCVVNETFTAIQEGKASPTVDNNFFITVVPIAQHTSERFISDFPRHNRDIDTRHPSHDEMKKTLSKSGSSGWTFVDRLADFNLLIYLADFLDVNADMPKVVSSIVDRSVSLDDGYKLLIKSMAGLEGSY
jgi:nuclear protein localization family protein 4